jgi:glutamate carboxypeptidase
VGETKRAIDEAVDEAFESEQLRFFARLVEQPSCSREKEDVEAAAAVIDEVVGALGLVRAVHPDADGVYADHRVYSTRAARDGDDALLLVGHVDTVFPRSSGFSGFVREGDRVRGPGVLDMKSGLCSVLFALRALKESSPSAFDRLRARFVVNTDEEVGSSSSRALIEELALRSTRALVFEGGRDGDRIVTRRKGTGFFQVVARGVAAHAGLHHADGTSAIHALALVVPRLEAITDYDRGITVNVGLIEGGSSKNTVPAEARCGIDVRYEHAGDGDAIRDHLMKAIDFALPSPLAGARFELDGGINRPPLEPTDATQALRLDYERHAAAVGLDVGEAPLQGGGSDANLVAATGVPCIDGLGPFGKHFHNPREWSSLESLRKRTKALARFLEAEAG